MYRVDALETVATREDEEGVLVPDPPRLQLSAEKVRMARLDTATAGSIVEQHWHNRHEDFLRPLFVLRHARTTPPEI